MPTAEEASGFNYGLGVAPFALVGASKIFTCAGDFAGGWTPGALASNAYGDSARISNNSWGTKGPRLLGRLLHARAAVRRGGA